MNLHQLYTEDRYVDFDELCSRMPRSQAELIWAEILAGRQPLTDRLRVSGKTLCRSRCVLEAELACEQKWNACRSQAWLLNSVAKTAVIPEPGLSWRQRFLRIRQEDPKLNPKLAELEPETLPLAEALLEVICAAKSEDQGCRLIEALLTCWQGTPILQEPLWQAGWQKAACDQDSTPLLLELCRSLTLQLDQIMIYLHQSCEAEGPLNMDYQQILLHYPMLKTHQIRFYVTHRQPGCHYTIAQFVSENQVAYETARCALDQLCGLGFYIKRKIGRKYSYQSR